MSLKQWETYYRGGALATCPTAPDGGYDFEVRAAWVEFFSTQPDGARILDIGTGNGVVALIALETAAQLGRNWEIHGIDLAAIDPPRFVADGERRFAGITFHAGVAMERLPFDDASFDAVGGHYALEYAADSSRALSEIHRVLKTGGDCQFVLHHPDSVFMRSAQAAMREAELVFTQTKIFRRLHRLVAMDQVVPGATERASTELRAAIRALKQALQQAQVSGGGRVLSVALNAVQTLLVARKEMQPHAAALKVDRAEADLRASVRGLSDLIEHARGPEDMDKLEREAAAAGFSLIEHMPLYHAAQNLVGWQLLLHRP
ncbi:class I SAM-dependent methyltransferase [Lysobacter korlensis]|uniref:Class I SAM-dependent methyltransferase n=1 Tax=Lysobacter korlensis TaxID=553636 RepID=A0ABV6S136_9GAMM